MSDVTGDGFKFDLDEDALQVVFTAPDGPIGKVLKSLTAKAERNAKRRCPVDTGRLRSSITSDVVAEEGALVGVVGTNVEYAPYVEFGTSRQPPAAFLRGGVDEALRDNGFTSGLAGGDA